MVNPEQLSMEIRDLNPSPEVICVITDPLTLFFDNIKQDPSPYIAAHVPAFLEFSKPYIQGDGIDSSTLNIYYPSMATKEVVINFYHGETLISEVALLTPEGRGQLDVVSETPGTLYACIPGKRVQASCEVR
jgi:hypothetical protein